MAGPGDEFVPSTGAFPFASSVTGVYRGRPVPSPYAVTGTPRQPSVKPQKNPQPRLKRFSILSDVLQAAPAPTKKG